MHNKIYRAYDIRGRYPSEINEKTVAEIGTALGQFWKKRKVVIGHDGRLSSSRLYRALKLGLAKGGTAEGRVLDVGLATTPMLYFFVHDPRVSGGIMVTASHNPIPMNGLKVVGKKSMPMSGFTVERLVRRGRT